MNILIIGGTNFIGPQVAMQLLGKGHAVTVFHRGRREPDELSAATHIHGDRKDLETFQVEFQKLKPDVVVDMICMKEADAVKTANVVRQVGGRVVMISSMDVYGAYGKLLGIEEGPPETELITEDSPLRTALYPYRAQSKGPDDFSYSYDKIPVERVIMSDSRLAATVLRLPAVYGPGDYQHRVGEYLKQMDAGSTVTLGEGGPNWKSTRGYAENVAAAIVAAVLDDRAIGRMYNVGESTLTEMEWVQAIARAAKWDGAIEVSEGEPWKQHLAVDDARIRRELGYAEPVPLDIAMQTTVAWERNARPR